jgi:hypothetical protein
LLQNIEEENKKEAKEEAKKKVESDAKAKKLQEEIDLAKEVRRKDLLMKLSLILLCLLLILLGLLESYLIIDLIIHVFFFLDCFFKSLRFIKLNPILVETRYAT